MAHGDLSQRLTDLELEVMTAVWAAAPEPCTVRQVVDAANEGREGRQHAYTTIQTVLNILVRKRVLRSRPGPGRAHLYAARVTRAEATRSMTRDLVERLFGGEVQPLVAQLLNDQSVGRDELEELKRVIEEQLEEPSPDSPSSEEEGE